jgi:hypothetical protein
MRLSHPEYNKLVFRTYQWLRSTPEFSSALKQPTPASIRKECLTLYLEQPVRDEPALRSFFGPAAENNSFLTPIKNFPTDGFRAFCNYLNGRAVNTDQKNIELLAWLIDFQHRPFRFSMDVVLNEMEKAILNSDKVANPPHGSDLNPPQEIEDEKDNNSDPPISNETEVNAQPATAEQVPVVPIKSDSEIKPIKKDFSKKWLIVGIALFLTILSLGVYSLYDKGDNCMYWTGDHYEKIDCDADVNDKVVFDEERWKNFRKITDLSAITEKSIGVVHYYGNKNREFYTSGGKHPVENTRYVKVMTRYIWEKEFGSKDSVVKGTSVDENKKLQLTNSKK